MSTVEANTAPTWVTHVMWWLPELLLTVPTVTVAVLLGSLLVLLPLVFPAVNVLAWAVSRGSSCGSAGAR